MGVADEHRPGSQEKIDIFVAADVPDPAAVSFGDDDIGGEVTKATRRQHAARPFHQVLFIVVLDHSRHGVFLSPDCSRG